jgi:dynein heavy chain, axonemal
LRIRHGNLRVCFSFAQEFVRLELGPGFVDPPAYELNVVFEETDVTTPIVFLLTPGTDPSQSFFDFAEEVGMRSRLDVISLGQGQAVAAVKLIEDACIKGNWVLLQVRSHGLGTFVGAAS